MPNSLLQRLQGELYPLLGRRPEWREDSKVAGEAKVGLEVGLSGANLIFESADPGLRARGESATVSTHLYAIKSLVEGLLDSDQVT